MNDKERWYYEMKEKAKNGFVEHEYCKYFDEYGFVRDGDCRSWCDKRHEHIENINVDNGCEYFDMGDIDDWE